MDTMENIKIIKIESNLQGQKVFLKYDGKEYILNTKLLGNFQVMNILSVLGTIISLKLEQDIQKIINCLEKLKNVEGRFEFIGQKENGAQIYIDIAHNPDALKNILEAMKEQMKNTNRKLFVLFGCEGDRDKEKRPLMGEIANKLADVVFITDDNPRNENPEEIRNEIFQACKKAYNISGREDAIKKAFNMLEENDVLILAGKGNEKFMIIKEKEIPFDEKKIIRECIGNE